jgi:hypothetical protein
MKSRGYKGKLTLPEGNDAQWAGRGGGLCDGGTEEEQKDVVRLVDTRRRFGAGTANCGEEVRRFDGRFVFCGWGVTALAAQVVGTGTWGPVT